MRSQDEIRQAFVARAVTLATRRRARRRITIAASALLLGLFLAGDVADACRWVCVSIRGTLYCRCR